MKLLRDTPTSSGEPSAAKRGSSLSSVKLCSRPLPKPDARIERDGLGRDAGRDAGARARAAGMRTPRRPRRGSAGSSAWYAARPACASGTRPPGFAPRTARAPGARSAYTSLTMQAPAAIAARHDRGLAGVDGDGDVEPAAMPSITGTTRSSLDRLGHRAARRAASIRRPHR